MAFCNLCCRSHSKQRQGSAIGYQSSVARLAENGFDTSSSVSKSAKVVLGLTARPFFRLFHLALETHDGRAVVLIPETSMNPPSHIDAVLVDRLKRLTPNGRLEKRTARGKMLTGTHDRSISPLSSSESAGLIETER
jgi:hypothetical protein